MADEKLAEALNYSRSWVVVSDALDEALSHICMYHSISHNSEHRATDSNKCENCPVQQDNIKSRRQLGFDTIDAYIPWNSKSHPFISIFSSQSHNSAVPRCCFQRRWPRDIRSDAKEADDGEEDMNVVQKQLPASPLSASFASSEMLSWPSSLETAATDTEYMKWIVSSPPQNKIK